MTEICQKKFFRIETVNVLKTLAIGGKLKNIVTVKLADEKLIKIEACQ